MNAALYHRKRREVAARRQEKARELGELAVRGDYDLPKHVLTWMNKGDLAAYLSRRGKTAELAALLVPYRRKRSC